MKHRDETWFDRLVLEKQWLLVSASLILFGLILIVVALATGAIR
jgi:hypothetical protein